MPENFTFEEKANFDRCILFMTRMLEKYREDVFVPNMEQGHRESEDH